MVLFNNIENNIEKIDNSRISDKIEAKVLLFAKTLRIVKAISLSPCLCNALTLTPKKGSSKAEQVSYSIFMLIDDLKNCFC